MKKTVAFVLLCAAFLAASPIARAQDTKQAAPTAPSGALEPARQARVDAARQQLRDDKRGLVERNMQLTPAEAKKFWPIYDQYQRARAGADARRAKAIVDVVGREGPLTDAYARTLAGELMAADEAEIKARRILQNRLMRAVSPRTAARYLQLEAKIRALEAYEIASSLPLVQ